jgi:uncharacterized membrane protein YccC
VLSPAKLATTVRTLHWGRGLRAGVSVATAMVICRLLHRPMGWAALGGFEAVLVDNGGPYRSRLNTIATVLFGGAVCAIVGTLVPSSEAVPGLLIAGLVTAAVCFAVTFARVASQPIASTAVIIIVIYFAGFGSADRTFPGALTNALAYILGGLWSAVLSLFFWPVDPFRPARLEVAGCYELLAAFASTLAKPSPQAPHPSHDDDHTHAVDYKRQLRAKLESAHAALGATPARAPVRTVRARNLTVLLETADMLFAASLRLAELAEIAHSDLAGQMLRMEVAETAQWLAAAERAIGEALQHKPADNASSFGPNGSHRLEFVTRPAQSLAAAHALPDLHPPDLYPEVRDALQNIAIAFEAVRAVWTGHEDRLIRATPTAEIPNEPAPDPIQAPDWIDALRQNWALDSVMMRHALRTAAVGVVDVLLMRAFHISHGFWLAMTSIIVLQPYSAGTVRKSFQRVGGTVGGGFLAAIFASAIHSQTGIIVVVTACSILTLATYAIDYGWYSFFLTPTFVLLSLPHLRDWRYAGIRIVTTLLGALVAVVAMRVLWPQSLTLELGRLLGRSAAATAAYVRAVLLFWQSPAATTRTQNRLAAERALLAPARRACGLASQDAEEALDRLMLEPSLPALNAASDTAPDKESALAFTTYIRRFTQCLTTLAAVATPGSVDQAIARLTDLTARLDAIAANLTGAPLPSEPEPSKPWALKPKPSPSSSLAEQMLQRMERQAGVLERATAILAPSAGPSVQSLTAMTATSQTGN